ncbi:MAG: flagellar export chaperone FliS [Betaproteobacteria bacterium]
MTGFGAKAYSKVSAETGARAADAHQLVLMLYDGAVEAARLALGHLQAGRVAQKAAALSRAARIVEEGLKVSLDRTAGGQIAERLSDLYDFMILRLLQANLRNDAAALGEVIRLLEDLRAAWVQIGRTGGAAAAVAPTAAASGASIAEPPAARPAAPAAAFVEDVGAARPRLAAWA